jgi:hypothetical protein
LEFNFFCSNFERQNKNRKEKLAKKRKGPLAARALHVLCGVSARAALSGAQDPP